MAFGAFQLGRARAGGDNPVARLLKPGKDDFFVIKPQFSGSIRQTCRCCSPDSASAADPTGITIDICLLFTAPTHRRDPALWVPEDYVAAEQDKRGQSPWRRCARRWAPAPMPANA
jgi:hypothetical protein